MNRTNNTPYNKTCEEQPTDCTFRFAEYRQGESFNHGYEDAHYIVYCSRGVTRLQSNLFAEEMIYGGEILFLPRMADCRGEVLDDSHVIIHTFNNSVCSPENCILSYLYKHNLKSEKTIDYRCKLLSHKAVDTFMESISLYLEDSTNTSHIWRMKHKELIYLLCRYYKPMELQAFFRPMIGEDIPFKNLVLTHYRKAHQTEDLAGLCGYSLPTFRRIFKEVFGLAPYQWLIKRRAEHVLHRLSTPHIIFADIIEEFNFSSSQQFNRFCKTTLGDTPSNLRQRHTHL